MNININEYDFKILVDNVKTANNHIKKLEYEEIHLPVPSIKQLRDVAYHIVKAIEYANSNSTDKEEKVQEHIQLAEKHALRAKYDIYEVRILYYLRNAETYIAKLTPIKETIEILPEYSNMITRIETIKDHFDENLNTQFSRDEFYENILSDIDELKIITTKLKANMHLVFNRHKERLDKEKIESRRYIRNLTIGILTLLATTVALLKT